MAGDARDDPTDEALFAAWVAGDEEAFRALFDRYLPVLRGIMGRGMPARLDVRDLVQQAFLQLHRARHDFRAGSRLRPWLVTIALNVKRQHLRKKRRRPEVSMDLEVGSLAPVTQPHDPVRAEDVRQLRAALATLAEGQREAIELHWMKGLSFAEVAEAVGASESAVKVRAHRGYARLRALLSRGDRNRTAPAGHKGDD